MKKLIGLAFILLLATASMAQSKDKFADPFKWISGSLKQTVLLGGEIEPIVYNCPMDETHEIKVIQNLVKGLKLGYDPETETCKIYGSVSDTIEVKTYTQSIKVILEGSGWENRTFEVTSEITLQDTPMKAKITQGSNKQSVYPGQKIEEIVYTFQNVESISVREGYSFPDGIIFSCNKNKGLFSSCSISGTIKDKTPREYEIILDVTSSIINEYQYYAEAHIWLSIVSDKVTLVSASAERTVTAGDEMEPIIYHSEVPLIDGYMKNCPEGIVFIFNPKTYEVTIQGTPDEQLKDSVYNYELNLIISDEESVKKTGTIIVNHKKAKTTLEIVENGEQDVLGGDSIKPIILKYNYMLNPAATKTLGSYSVMANAEKRIITIKGKVPNVHKDTTLIITVTAEGYENNASVDVKINVKHKQATTSITTLTNNSEQTINAGESISPITFQYTNADSLWTIGTLPGKFKLEVVSKEDRTFNLVGTIDPNADAGKYELGIVVRGTDNNDTAYVYIHVNQEFRPIVFELIEGSLEQTVTAGNPITPMVFRYANIKKLGITGLPNGINYKKDSEAHEFTIYGSIAPDAISFPYEFTIDITGVDEDSTITGKITVEKPASSSSNVIASSSSVKSSSSSTKPVESSSSSVIASSSSVKASSSSAKPVESSSSSVIASSSSVKSSSSSAKPVESSSSSVIASSSTNVNSSSSSKQVEVSSSSAQQPSSSSKPVEASSSSTTASSSSVNNSSSSSATPASSSTEVSSSSTKQSSSSKPAEVSSSSKKESSSSKGKEPSEKSSSSNKAKSSSSEEDTFVIAKIINPMTISLEGRMLHISGAKWVNIDVFDMQGRSVASFKQVKSSASLESLLQGCYIVRVQSGSNSLTRRIAIK